MAGVRWCHILLGGYDGFADVIQSWRPVFGGTPIKRAGWVGHLDFPRLLPGTRHYIPSLLPFLVDRLQLLDTRLRLRQGARQLGDVLERFH